MSISMSQQPSSEGLDFTYGKHLHSQQHLGSGSRSGAKCDMLLSLITLCSIIQPYLSSSILSLHTLQLFIEVLATEVSGR
jgi:hypothetical protein